RLSPKVAVVGLELSLSARSGVAFSATSGMRAAEFGLFPSDATARISVPSPGGTVMVEPLPSFFSVTPVVSHHVTVILSFSASVADFTVNVRSLPATGSILICGDWLADWGRTWLRYPFLLNH